MPKNTSQLNKRQETVLSILEAKTESPILNILKELSPALGAVTKITLNRDLKKLIDSGFIVSRGKGRATIYKLSPHYLLVKPINAADYFKTETDKRAAKSAFNFEIFSILKDIFSDKENKYLNDLNEKYLNNVKSLSKTILKNEFERLTIELSWKSSQIEGNAYTLLETEALIKENKEARGRKKEEAIMILNHKSALDYIQKNKLIFKKISAPKIEQIHYLLTKNLNISKNIRKTAVGITGTKYRPLGNEFQIKEALEKTCVIINKEKNPFAKALLLSAMIAYIQPFEDGNKRTSRLLSNAILTAHNICPLSYRSVDDTEYKKAVIIFYEQNNINYFKELFIQQFEFAVNNYFSK